MEKRTGTMGTGTGRGGGARRRRLAATATVAALLAGMVTVGAGAAHAGPPLCNGQPATIVGDAGPNTIWGTPAKDVIHAGAGADVVVGQEGDDVICGGPGVDTLWGRIGTDVLIGGDLIIGDNDGTDYLHGGPDQDSLFGGDGNDFVYGEGGSDVLYGNLGNDLLDGGVDSNDAVFYQYALQGVAADLAAGKATGDGNDLLVAVERLVGSRFSDRLYGDSLNNVFIGLEGNDLMDGRAGSDSIKYATDIAQGINANLTTGIATGVGHGSDRMVSIENLSGSLQNDVLVGDAGPNILGGRVGNDTVMGMGGNDTLSGGGDSLPGPDNDWVVGGDGNDVLNGNEGDDVLDGGPGTDPGDGGTGIDSCSNLEPATNCP